MLGTTKDDPLKNRMMFGFGRSMMNMLMKGFINKNRAKYGLPPIKDIWAHWLGENVIVACDKELNAAREGVSFCFYTNRFYAIAIKERFAG